MTNRYFFDTEFIDDGERIRLISIGIAAEDGREYYAELLRPIELKMAGASDWVITNVAPHLIGKAAFRAREWAAAEIQGFIGANPEFWAYVADYDWVALSQLYGPLVNRPETWPWTALDTYQLPDFKTYVIKPTKPHHALADAIALRESWKRWRVAWPDYPLPTPK